MKQKLSFTKANRVHVIDILAGLDWGSLALALNEWKPGTKGYLTVTKESKPKSSMQLGYYYAVILPAALEAFKDNGDFSLCLEVKGKRFEVELTKPNVDQFLKLRYAAYSGKYVDKTEMDMAECSFYEDWCIKWLATWLDCQVPPADTTWRNIKK